MVDKMRTHRLRRQAEPIAQECIAVRIRLLNRIITNIYDTAMRPFGISLNQASILTVIAMSDDAGYGDISRILYMEKSTVSRNVERMKKKGWVAIGVGDETGSAVITITPAGERVLQQAYGAWVEAQKEAARCLGPDGVQALKKLAVRYWPMGSDQES